MCDEITYQFGNSDGAAVEVFFISFGISYFTFYWAYGYVSILGSKLIHVSKRGRWFEINIVSVMCVFFNLKIPRKSSFEASLTLASNCDLIEQVTLVATTETIILTSLL